jgi:AcrR family transcriptional regulator
MTGFLSSNAWIMDFLVGEARFWLNQPGLPCDRIVIAQGKCSIYVRISQSIDSGPRASYCSALIVPENPTRDALLHAAQELFSHHGFSGVSTREIALQANVNLGAIQYHFGSKFDLYLAVMEQVMQNPDSAEHWTILSECPAAADPHQAALFFARFIDGMMRSMLAESEFKSCALLVVREALRPTEATDIVVERYMRPNKTQLIGVLTAIQPTVPGEQIHRTADSILGQVFHYRMFREFIERAGNTNLGDPNQVRQVADHIIIFSLRGLGCDEQFAHTVIQTLRQPDRSTADAGDAVHKGNDS